MKERRRRKFESYFNVVKYFKYFKLKVLDYEINKWVVVFFPYMCDLFMIFQIQYIYIYIYIFSMELKVEAS